MDEWIMLGDERYQNAGLWFKQDHDVNADVNEFLLADKCIHLLRTAAPVSEQIVSSATGGSAYLVLDYDQVPVAFVEFFPGDGRPGGTGGRTRVWVDSSNDTLARVDAALGGEGQLRAEVSQGYTSYGAAIEIQAPDVLAEIEQ